MSAVKTGYNSVTILEASNGGFTPPDQADVQVHIDAQNHSDWALIQVMLVGNKMMFFWYKG